MPWAHGFLWFWGCCFSKKISFFIQVFKPTFLKWVEFIEHSSLNYLGLGENPFSSWWSFKKKVEIKLRNDSKHVPEDEGVVVMWEGTCQVVHEGLEILSSVNTYTPWLFFIMDFFIGCRSVVFYLLEGFPRKFWCCLIVAHSSLHFVFSF